MRIPHTLTNWISPPIWCVRNGFWLCSLALFWWAVSSASFFWLLSQQGLVLTPAAQWVQVKGLQHIKGGSLEWKPLESAPCLCCSNSGKLMNPPGSKSGVGIEWDSAQKGVSPVPRTAKHPVTPAIVTGLITGLWLPCPLPWCADMASGRCPPRGIHTFLWSPPLECRLDRVTCF